MTRERVPQSASGDQRRWNRVKLSVPVQIRKGKEPGGGPVPTYPAVTTDLSVGGLYVTSEEGRFVPGELVSVSVSIPWEARQAFPFSRLSGSCRVVRFEDLRAEASMARQGLALAFCGDGPTCLGAIVVPR